MSETSDLTPKQRELVHVAAGDARHVLAYGGSRSGKTFGFCYCVATRAIKAPSSRHLICRLQNIDVRQSVLMDTWPTMMRKRYPGVKWTPHLSDQYVTFDHNGAEVWFGGLDDKERVEKILGKEYATIYPNETSQIVYETILTLRTRLAQKVLQADGRGLSLKMYYDLNPVGRGHWTYKEFVQQVRPDNGQPISGRAHVVLNPQDNAVNLPGEYLEELSSLPERHRQRFYEGKYLTEVPGTLWPVATIDKGRVSHAPALRRIVIAIDPSGGDGTGNDSQGIVAAGLGEDGRAYVLRDASVKLSPAGWARVAGTVYDELAADAIVAEVNYGGAMVEHTLRSGAPNARVVVRNASRGKHIRAEPVSALYEQGKVSHVGRFPELEDQMAMFTTDGYTGGDSPDRVDALVWAIDELMLAPQRPKAQSRRFGWG